MCVTPPTLTRSLMPGGQFLPVTVACSFLQGSPYAPGLEGRPDLVHRPGTRPLVGSSDATTSDWVTQDRAEDYARLYNLYVALDAIQKARGIGVDANDPAELARKATESHDLRLLETEDGQLPGAMDISVSKLQELGHKELRSVFENKGDPDLLIRAAIYNGLILKHAK
jgi:hypothetical protein